MRWGVLSVANIASRRVIPALLVSESEQLVAVASRNPARTQEVLGKRADIQVYDDYAKLIADPQIEAIYNPLPNSLHAEWTIKALLAGKHVLCERPLAMTVEQGTLMVEAARSNQRLLMEACMYRFHPQMFWTLEQVRTGRLGEIRQVRATFSYKLPTQTHANDIRLQAELGGGSLMDVGCYLVNFSRAVYGHPPTAVAARVYRAEEAQVEHVTNAILDFDDGRFAQLEASFVLPTYQMAEIVGEEGSLFLLSPFVTGLHETEVILRLEGQTIHQKIQPVDAYRLELEHFGSCVRSGCQPALPLEETLENLATLAAIYQAAGYRWPLS